MGAERKAKKEAEKQAAKEEKQAAKEEKKAKKEEEKQAAKEEKQAAKEAKKKNKKDEEESFAGSGSEDVTPVGTGPADILEGMDADAAAHVAEELKPGTAAGIVEDGRGSCRRHVRGNGDPR